MARRRKATKRKILQDPVFKNTLAARCMNMIMRDGKKSIAERIFYTAVRNANTKINEQDPIKVFTKAVDNVKPVLEVKSRRVGGATYQVPVEISKERQEALALRWMLMFARKRSGMSMAESFAMELCDAYNGQGLAIKKREETHRMAEANRAFAHYKW